MHTKFPEKLFHPAGILLVICVLLFVFTPIFVSSHGVNKKVTGLIKLGQQRCESNEEKSKNQNEIFLILRVGRYVNKRILLTLVIALLLAIITFPPLFAH